MNQFGNYDNGFNVRFYVSLSVKGTSFQNKFCFAAVYLKWNVGGSTTFECQIISTDRLDDWVIYNGGSTEGNFWLNIIVNTVNASITEIYLRIS